MKISLYGIFIFLIVNSINIAIAVESDSRDLINKSELTRQEDLIDAITYARDVVAGKTTLEEVERKVFFNSKNRWMAKTGRNIGVSLNKDNLRIGLHGIYTDSHQDVWQSAGIITSGGPYGSPSVLFSDCSFINALDLEFYFVKRANVEEHAVVYDEVSYYWKKGEKIKFTFRTSIGSFEQYGCPRHSYLVEIINVNNITH